MMDVGTDVEVEEVDMEDWAGIFGVEGTALLIFMADLSDLSSCILLNISSSDSGRGAKAIFGTHGHGHGLHIGLVKLEDGA